LEWHSLNYQDVEERRFSLDDAAALWLYEGVYWLTWANTERLL